MYYIEANGFTPDGAGGYGLDPTNGDCMAGGSAGEKKAGSISVDANGNGTARLKMVLSTDFSNSPGYASGVCVSPLNTTANEAPVIVI
jgi:hypothetical protein